MEVYTLNDYNQLVANYLTPTPKEVEGLNNTSYFYYDAMLFSKVMSLFKIEGAPEHWDTQYLLEHLFRDGCVCITKKAGVVWPLQTGYAGINVYNKPTECIIANPVLGNFKREIGKDCVLVYMLRMRDHFFTLNNLIKRYAVLLAQCDGTLNTTLINSRVAHVFEGKSKAELKTLQKMYDDVTNGKPAVFLNKEGGEFQANHSFLNVKNTFIGVEILDVKRTIMNEFLTEIGINNSNTDKKERLITDEVNSNKQEIKTNVSVWLDQLTKCFDEVNAMFGLNIKISLREEDEQDESNQRISMVEQ